MLACLPVYGAPNLDSPDPSPTRNTHPFIRIFGLPTPAPLSPIERGSFSTSLDITSYSKDNIAQEERLILDGELYQLRFFWRHALNERFELGLEVPYLYDSGGFLDRIIDNWHDLLGVTINSRDEAPRDRLLHVYEDPSGRLAIIDSSSSGFGDVRLDGRWIFAGAAADAANRLALRAGAKLATGSDGEYRGSGAHDFFLLLEGMSRRPLLERLRFGGSLGVVWLGEAEQDVLGDIQEDWVVVGHLTGTIQVLPAWQLVLQLEGHGGIYNSDLRALRNDTLQFSFGTRWGFGENYVAEFMVSEDPLSDTAPDVNFFFGLRRNY